MTFNTLKMTWTDEGCVAVATGFAGTMLTCPRCQALLPRDEVHRCGDEVARPAKKTVGKKRKMKPAK